VNTFTITELLHSKQGTSQGKAYFVFDTVWKKRQSETYWWARCHGRWEWLLYSCHPALSHEWDRWRYLCHPPEAKHNNTLIHWNKHDNLL